ncbi:MAG: cytochrome d ubiquinol oxidase subunit II [Kiritimatiellae bacterium]|nr:cytochrome d ubiquinol oxidase subunit II [Kiritimatiellia bacterium]
MDLNTIWFILISILFIGYFFLEGFDFGVGILLPFVSRDDTDRRVVINSVGPFWDGNEVWLITAGGAIFAAFPHWYATLFSGFYLPLFLILIALILRAVGFEFRSKIEAPRWRRMCDQFLFWGSFIPAFLWGVAFANFVRGVPIGADMNYAGGFWNLLNPYALLGGLTSLSVFTLHGAVFLCLRTEGEVRERAHGIAARLWGPAAVILIAFAAYGYVATDFHQQVGVVPGTMPLLAICSYIAILVFLRMERDGWAFIATSLTILFGAVVVFEGLFPRVLLSSLDPAWHLTIYNASSSPLTLKVMLGVALLFVPIILGYQGWSYYVFRQRLTRESIPEHALNRHGQGEKT